MVCPICNKRKAKRLCPARAESICSICCGTEREVTIDCPSDCVHLMASRDYDLSHWVFEDKPVPFPEMSFNRQFMEAHGGLMIQFDYATCQFAAEHREIVDTDVLAALERLAETYRTQASGLIYEKPIDYPPQKALYEHLKAAIADYRKKEAEQQGMTTLRDSDVRDTLICLSQLCASRLNGRLKGRNYLDLIRQQFPKDTFRKAASNIVIL